MNEFLFRVSHQADFDDPASGWHSLLFLFATHLDRCIVHNRAYVCPECRRWRSYNPRMAVQLRRGYRELWDFWNKKDEKKKQKTLVEKTENELKADAMFQDPRHVRQIPILWINDDEEYPIVVEPDSQWDYFDIRSNKYSGWHIIWLECKTAYGLPLKVFMSVSEFADIKRHVEYGRPMPFRRRVRNNIRSEISVNTAEKEEADRKRAALEAHLAGMFPAEKDMPQD